MLPCNIPIKIVKPLTVIKHLVSFPLDDKDKSYYTVLYKQTYSYNELLQTEHKTEHKSHTSPIQNTPDKLPSVMNNRTLRDITDLLDPYKQNPSETPITTVTHAHVYEVALGGSVHETGIRWDVHTFPLVGHTQQF